VLICLLFFGLVAFGYMSAPSGGSGNNNTSASPAIQNVTGTVLYNDGRTPLPLTSISAGNYVRLFNTTNMSVTSTFVTDNNGTFTSPDVPAGEYILSAWDSNTQVAHIDITIPTGVNLLQNLTTSRMPTNKKRYEALYTFLNYKINLKVIEAPEAK
jgi:hypothetical protein